MAGANSRYLPLMVLRTLTAWVTPDLLASVGPSIEQGGGAPPWPAGGSTEERHLRSRLRAGRGGVPRDTACPPAREYRPPPVRGEQKVLASSFRTSGSRSPSPAACRKHRPLSAAPPAVDAPVSGVMLARRLRRPARGLRRPGRTGA